MNFILKARDIVIYNFAIFCKSLHLFTSDMNVIQYNIKIKKV